MNGVLPATRGHGFVSDRDCLEDYLLSTLRTPLPLQPPQVVATPRACRVALRQKRSECLEVTRWRIVEHEEWYLGILASIQFDSPCGYSPE